MVELFYLRKFILACIGLFLGLTVFFSCAQLGNPSGGPKDIAPPKYLASYPDTLSTNVDVNLKEIQIDFDEYLVLKEPNKQVVVSPPLEGNPIYHPFGSPKKYVRIELKEPLAPNTTYSFNFGEAIQDNNENNKLDGYKFVFSTGDFIDSLRVTGKVKNTLEKKLPENIVVGLYKIDSTYNDSLILKGKPYYISKLDSINQYDLDYLHDGKYQLVAFNDEIPNLKLEPESELVGFLKGPIELTENTSFDLQLFPPVPPYKAIEAKQKGYGDLVFKFRGEPESVVITPIDVSFKTKQIDFKPRTDSLQFWFNPKIDSISDKKTTTIKFQVKHKDKIDTLRLLYRTDNTPTLAFSEKNKSNYSPNKKFKLKSNYPLESIDSSFIKVYKDSTQIAYNTILSKEEQSVILDFPLNFKSAYQVDLLPGAITDFFGEKNDTLSYQFRIPDERQFGNLKLKLDNVPKQKFWLKFYDSQDKLLDEFYGNQAEFDYKNLKPGEYSFKLLVDENENGFWDTGDFFTRRQPEKVYIYPAKITIRAFWDADETWVLK